MLVVFIVVLATYILLAPILPQLDYIMNPPATVKAPAFVAAPENTTQNNSDVAVAETTEQATGTGSTSQVLQNQLYIPSIGAMGPIIEGTAPKTVDKGLWRRPATSEPGKGGNTVIVGHRFSYNHGVVQPFYHLDKVKIGDTIYVLWNGQKYTYNVTDKKVVNKSEISVEAPTSSEQLTLYTCTPVWNPIDRLVVIAKPAGGKNE